MFKVPRLRRVGCVLTPSAPASVQSPPSPGLTEPQPRPPRGLTHTDEARGESRERDVGPGGLGVGTAVPELAHAHEAVVVGAEGHGRDQGHRAHGQREAPIEAPYLAGRWTGPEGRVRSEAPPRRASMAAGRTSAESLTAWRLSFPACSSLASTESPAHSS